MEKFLEPYDKEYMKMAMLKHEETFREQVHELHRLYRIQKMLMKNIGHSRPSSSNRINHDSNYQQPQQKLDLEQPAEEFINEDGVLDNKDECEIELTLGPSSFSRRMKPDTPLTSDYGPSFSFSSSSTGSSSIKRSSQSGIHHRTDQATRGGPNMHKWSLVEVPRGSNPSFLTGRKSSSSDVEEHQFRQDRLKQAPWLFQVLSLNMT